MTRYNTLLLDNTVWDLVLDSSGNIAMATPAYSVAQDVASAIRLFINELWYDPGKGIPYFETILGDLPPLGLLAGQLENAALTVPGVVQANAIITEYSPTSRKIGGQVQFIDEVGQANGVQF